MGENRLKVLSLYWGFSIGGIAKYAQLVDAVSDYQPIDLEHVCILSNAWHCDDQTLSGLNVERVQIASRLDFSWLGRVDALISRSSPDVIFTHGFNGHLVALVLRILRGRRIPSVISYHGLYHAVSALRRVIAPLYNEFTEYYCRERAGRVVSVTDYSKTYLIGKGVSPDKIDVIHNGIPDVESKPDTRARIRAEWGFDDGDIVVVSTSRLDHVKGLVFLIEAVASLANELPSLKLAIVGTGSLDTDLRSRAKALALGDRVVFPGFRSDIAGCLDACDIYALPSLAEYHSIALLEAMRAEKAIVATSVGGNTESVRNGQEAIVISPGSSEHLAAAIRMLAGDPAARARLAAAARNRYLGVFQDSVMVRRTAQWLMDSAARGRGV